VEGKYELIQIPPGFQSKNTIIIKDRGLYLNESDSQRGNLVINFIIKIPNGNYLNHKDKVDILNILKLY